MTNMQTSGLGPHSDIEQWFSIAETVVLSTAMLFGVFGNLLIIITVTMSKQIRTVPNVYVASLATANLILSAVVCPYFVVTIWRNQRALVEPAGCGAMAYTTLVVLIITLYNHAAISINRYTMVTKSKKIYMGLYKSWKVSLSLILIWSIPLLMFTAPYFGLGTYGYNTRSEMCFLAEESYQEKTYWYIVTSDIVGPVLTFFITMICHLKIMRHFKSSRQRVIHKKKTGGTFDENSVGGSSHTGSYTYPYMGSTGQLNIPNCGAMGGLNLTSNLMSRHTKHQQPSSSVVKNLILPWVFLLLLRLPLVIVHIVDRDERLAAIYHHIGLTLVFLNPLADFVIYALLNRQMRQYFKAMLNCRSPNSIKYIPH